ncbi:MAG: efflux RND transporter periplasmic adaptor subunit [Spirochaetaceae bacterium]|nr:efflux RND transporter periplasmic adaptor subunit [Spirochaetaceae bacterium]
MTTKETDKKELSTEEKVQNTISNKKKMAKRKKLIRNVVVLIIVIGGIYVYSNYKSTGYFPWQNVKTIEALKAPVPKEFIVKKLKYSTTVDISGELEPLNTQSVHSKSAGTVTSVLVIKGDSVKKGDLLVTIDDTNIQYNIAKLESEIKSSKLKGTSSDVELLQMELKSYKSELEDTKLYAPISGIVSILNVEVGDYAVQQDNCATIIDPTKLIANVDIDEIDLRYITTSSIANITYESLPGVMSKARISYMPYAGTLSTEGIGVKNVEFTIDNPPKGIYPGYSFGGTIEGTSQEEIIILSDEAVKTDDKGSYVLKKTTTTPEKIYVTTNNLSEGYVEILTGNLIDGDTVLVMPIVTAKAASSSSGLLGGNLMGGAHAPGDSRYIRKN